MNVREDEEVTREIQASSPQFEFHQTLAFRLHYTTKFRNPLLLQ